MHKFKLNNENFRRIILAGRLEALLHRGVSDEVAHFIMSIEEDEEQKFLANAAFRNPQISINEISDIYDELASRQKIFPGQKQLFRTRYGDDFKKWIISRTKQFFKNGIPENLFELSEELNNIFDWMFYKKQENPRFNIASYSWESAVESQQKWHDSFEINDGSDYQMRDPSPILYAPEEWDGWSIRLVKEQNDFDCEGNKMGHCVGRGRYFKEYENKKIIIVSLRDENNNPHATIELEFPRKRDNPIDFKKEKEKAESITNNGAELINSFFKEIKRKPEGDSHYQTTKDIFGDYNSINLTPENIHTLFPLYKIFISNQKQRTGDDDFDVATESSVHENDERMAEEYDEDDYDEEGFYKVKQIQGKQNSYPIPAYRNKINDFLYDREAYDKLIEILDIEERNISSEHSLYISMLDSETEATVENLQKLPLELVLDIFIAQYWSFPDNKREEIYLYVRSLCLEDPIAAFVLSRFRRPYDNLDLEQVIAQDEDLLIPYLIEVEKSDFIKNKILESGNLDLIFPYILFIEGIRWGGYQEKLEEGEVKDEKSNLVQMPLDRFQPFVLSDPTLSVEFAFFNGENEIIKQAALTDPMRAVEWADMIDEGPSDETRFAASKNVNAAIKYAIEVDEGPHPVTMQAIIDNPEENKDKYAEIAGIYLWKVPNAENIPLLKKIAFSSGSVIEALFFQAPKIFNEDDFEIVRQQSEKSPRLSLAIAQIEGPSDDTRYIASLHSLYALIYAKEIDKGPHPVTRWGVSLSPYYAHKYALEIDKFWHPLLLKAVEGSVWRNREDVEPIEVPEEEMVEPEYYSKHPYEEDAKFETRNLIDKAKLLVKFEKEGEHKKADKILQKLIKITKTSNKF